MALSFVKSKAMFGITVTCLRVLENMTWFPSGESIQKIGEDLTESEELYERMGNYCRGRTSRVDLSPICNKIVLTWLWSYCINRLRNESSAVRIKHNMLKHKCLPILLYALEVCNLDKRTLLSLDYTVNRFFMKLFRTSNIETVHCQNVFGCELPSVLLATRYDKFIQKIVCTSV